MRTTWADIPRYLRLAWAGMLMRLLIKALPLSEKESIPVRAAIKAWAQAQSAALS
ncbi:MAG: hypothetical protein RJA55_606 [Acidobacteriota bacterium]|jgi:hypothetical protein